MIYAKDRLRIVTRCGLYKIQVRDTMVGALSGQFKGYEWNDLDTTLFTSLEDARDAVVELCT